MPAVAGMGCPGLAESSTAPLMLPPPAVAPAPEPVPPDALHGESGDTPSGNLPPSRCETSLLPEDAKPVGVDASVGGAPPSQPGEMPGGP